MTAIPNTASVKETNDATIHKGVIVFFSKVRLISFIDRQPEAVRRPCENVGQHPTIRCYLLCSTERLVNAAELNLGAKEVSTQRTGAHPPGTVLTQQSHLRALSEWYNQQAAFLEIDLESQSRQTLFGVPPRTKEFDRLAGSILPVRSRQS